MRAMAVKVDGDWCDVVAMVRDLQGEKWLVWQRRTGEVGIVKAARAMCRVE